MGCVHIHVFDYKVAMLLILFLKKKKTNPIRLMINPTFAPF